MNTLQNKADIVLQIDLIEQMIEKLSDVIFDQLEQTTNEISSGEELLSKVKANPYGWLEHGHHSMLAGIMFLRKSVESID